MVVGAESVRTARAASDRRAITSAIRPFAHRPVVPLIVLALLAGLSLIVVSTPIIGRGDYGQWLMTSRYYLGSGVPDYRTISALPPVVPAGIALVRTLIADPVIALQLLNVLLLVGLGASFYLFAVVLLDSRLSGLIAVAAGLLVTDRFMELFAFGGILQIAATIFMILAATSLAKASRGRTPPRHWWYLGAGLMTLAALTHVGTAAIAVPTALVVAGISSWRLRAQGWPAIKSLNGPLVAGLGIIGAYWLLILLPSSREYVTNPASLAYRGPERLFSSLVSYWPTTILLVGGATGIAMGAWREFGVRRIGGYGVLLACALVPWGALGYSIVSGTATDYPRFATPLLVPLVVGFGGGVVQLLSHAGPGLGRRWRVRLPIAMVVVLIAATAPLAVGRYVRQATVYQPRDAMALNQAVQWIDSAIDPGQSVLTAVRDGKWLEGMTGREALFSQPVRYAFRRAEWQRSVDADSLLRSTAALSNGYFRAMYTGTASNGDVTIPTGFLLGVNHGGEYVDLLRALPSDGSILGPSGIIDVRDLLPVRAVSAAGSQSARITTVRSSDAASTVTFARRVTVLRNGTRLELRDASPGNTLETILKPPDGMALISVTGTAQQSTVCFAKVGGTEPCLGIEVTQPDAVLDTSEGALRIRTATSDELQIFISALTAGPPSVDLRILDPGRIVDDHRVGAALLYADDPAFESRVRRLEALGFGEAASFGPYRVLLHQRPLENAAKGA
jgi:hypothetical protein